MKEKQIEQYLIKRVKELGGRAYKFVSPGNAGVPDRIVCLPGGKVVFVELKAPGKSPTPLQQMQIIRLKELGQAVYVLESMEEVDFFIQTWGRC